jgi:hypothetical protein
MSFTMRAAMPSPTLTTYETEQLARLREWQAQSPGFLTRSFAKAAGPAGNVAQKLIPTAALKAALDGVQSIGARVSDRRSILKHAGVGSIAELRALELQACDRLAARVRLRAMLLAGSSGAAFGIAGGFGMVADVPTLLLQTFRSIHRTALCYGEALDAPQLRRLPIAVFALASANTVEEKRAALGAIDHDSHSAAWRDGMERVAQREFAKDAAMFSLRNLAKTLTEHLGLRKAAGSIPITGALIGGGVNAWYLGDVTQAAKTTFQLRWLRAKYGETAALEILPLHEALTAE